MTTRDPVARRLAAIAVGLAALALMLSIYALMMTFEHRAQVRALGDVFHKIGTREVPMTSPPAQLDPDDR
jgi:hypothetical protein